jgi:hypothetical protein
MQDPPAFPSRVYLKTLNAETGFGGRNLVSASTVKSIHACRFWKETEELQLHFFSSFSFSAQTLSRKGGVSCDLWCGKQAGSGKEKDDALTETLLEQQDLCEYSSSEREQKAKRKERLQVRTG